MKHYDIKGLQRRSSRPKAPRKSTVPDDLCALVLTLRRTHPTYRKAKIHAQLYAKATAKSSVKFLDELQGAPGLPIRSIQIGGESEFMSLFEHACKEREIPLYVLPPKSPQKNGGVERMNRTIIEDLYNRPNMAADSIVALRFELKNTLKTYTTHIDLTKLSTARHYTSILKTSSKESSLIQYKRVYPQNLLLILEFN